MERSVRVVSDRIHDNPTIRKSSEFITSKYIRIPITPFQSLVSERVEFYRTKPVPSIRFYNFCKWRSDGSRWDTIIGCKKNSIVDCAYPGQTIILYDLTSSCIWSYMILYDHMKIIQKIVRPKILDQVVQSDSWNILSIYKTVQESDCVTWSKISGTTIFCQILVRFHSYSKILHVFHKILCQIFRPRY